MDQRKKQILSALMAIYQETAEPVGSKALARKGSFPLSSATIRNEFALLERQGYLVQPHTSAGRVPTVKAYRDYIENLSPSLYPSPLVGEGRVRGIKLNREGIKTLARQVAEISEEAVFIAFDPKDTYYTGLSNLLSQPEFQDLSRTVRLGETLDHLDSRVQEFFGRETKNEIEISIGKESPFGEELGTIFFGFGNNNSELFGLFGPLRMDWQKNVGLMKYVREIVG